MMAAISAGLFPATTSRALIIRARAGSLRGSQASGTASGPAMAPAMLRSPACRVPWLAEGAEIT